MKINNIKLDLFFMSNLLVVVRYTHYNRKQVFLLENLKKLCYTSYCNMKVFRMNVDKSF